MTKKIGLSILAILLSACVLLSVVLIIAVVMITRPQTTAVKLTSVPTIEATLSENTAVPATNGTTTVFDKQMDQIQEEVMSYRGLTMTKPLSRALLSTAQLKDHVINEFFADYTAEDAKKDAEELSAFGLLPADFDLHDFYIKLYSEQIAGYYDQKTKDMYTVSDEGFNGTERMTYAHEFTHVLQDQTYDLENGLKMNEEYCKNETEYCAAVSALVEGDATLTEQYWFYKFSTDLDKQQVTQFQQTYTSPVYDSAPAYMKEDFLFPYSQGLNFVSSLYSKNKWKSIDAAYKNPPVSTEQILHPEKYPKEVPIKVDVPDLLPTLGNSWAEIDRNVMGEWYTYLVLYDGRTPSIQLDQQVAKDASAGWGGDTYVYYANDTAKQFVLVWKSVWDTKTDSDEYWQASLSYGNARWGTPLKDSTTSISWQSDSEGLVTMQQLGKMVLWMMTPSTGIQTQLLDALNINGN
ncbi:MAG: hypothetical protein AB9897_04195 [Anaerolineaceae bacterium]